MATTRVSNPETNTRYAEYLNSTAWKQKRIAVLERCDGVCERCAKFLVDEVHHLSYVHVFDERLEELQGLCRPCHAFLHGASGIDPLADSLLIKVSWKLIQYWDRAARKFRRITWAKLGKPDGVHADRQLGQFRIPMDVFFDREGKPAFDPLRWEKYRFASRIGRRWYHHGESGRSIPRDPWMVNDEVIGLEHSKANEEKRQSESPESYTSYEGRTPRLEKEVMALFRKYPRIIACGKESRIIGVRSTLTRGIVLDLEYDKPGGGWVRHKIYKAEARLNEGAILLDHTRATWVTKEQSRLPRHILANFGLIEGEKETG